MVRRINTANDVRETWFKIYVVDEINRTHDVMVGDGAEGSLIRALDNKKYGMRSWRRNVCTRESGKFVKRR